MTEGMQRDIGRLEGRVNALETELREIKGDVKSILAVVNQAQGGWKTLVVVGTISGGVGAFIGKLLPFLNTMPR